LGPIVFASRLCLLQTDRFVLPATTEKAINTNWQISFFLVRVPNDDQRIVIISSRRKRCSKKRANSAMGKDIVIKNKFGNSAGVQKYGERDRSD
jgi:hypothetical protein